MGGSHSSHGLGRTSPILGRPRLVGTTGFEPVTRPRANLDAVGRPASAGFEPALFPVFARWLSVPLSELLADARASLSAAT